MALSAVLVAFLLLNNRTTLDMGPWGVVVVLLIGAAFGFLSSLVHLFGKIPSFLVSYGISNIGMGLALFAYKGYPGNVADEGFRQLGLGTVMGAPIISWIAIGVFLVALFIQQYTAFGRHIFAIGQNEPVARTSGINVNRTIILAFVFCGVCVALAGVFGTALLGRGEANIGKFKAFPAITAVVVGGTPLSGGRGGILNSLVGALIITLLQMGMVFYGVSANIQTGIQGLIILVAVILSITRDKRFIVK